MEQRSKSNQLLPVDWELAALDALRLEGLNGVAVEPLAKKLRVTKGSFYWHFKNREALIVAALERWEQQSTGEINNRLLALKDARERLRVLIRVSLSSAQDPLLSAISKSTFHARVREVLQRVTQTRIDFIRSCYLELGTSEGAAQIKAVFAYTTYLGLVHLESELAEIFSDETNRERYIDFVLESLVPHPNS